jgi:class 3 adenylate cyclase
VVAAAIIAPVGANVSPFSVSPPRWRCERHGTYEEADAWLARTGGFWQEWLKHGTFPDHPGQRVLRPAERIVRALARALARAQHRPRAGTGALEAEPEIGHEPELDVDPFRTGKPLAVARLAVRPVGGSCWWGGSSRLTTAALSGFDRDGFLASFNSAHGGLHAAVDLMRTFSGGGGDLALRVGVHSGFVISGGEEMLGRNVVLASRIAAFTGAGEVLVSSNLKKYTERELSFVFEPSGRVRK